MSTGNSILNNGVINAGGSPAILAGALADRPVQGYEGLLYVSYDPGNEGIYRYVTGTGWVALTSGGGGGVGTLQQVCNNGNDTNTQVISYNNTGEGSTIGFVALGNQTTDNRGIELQSDEAEQCGLILFTNASGTTAKVKGDLLVNGSPNEYQLPDKGGTPDTFAMLSDLSAIPSIQSDNAYIPSIAGLSNVTSLFLGEATYIRIANVTIVSFQFIVTPTAAGTKTTVQTDVPTTISQQAGQAIGSGSWSDGTLHGAVQAIETAAGTRSILSFTSGSALVPIQLYCVCQYAN